MGARIRIGRAGVAALFFLTAAHLPGQHGDPKKKYEEPKPQILPLPRELPMALVADTSSLDFHVSPLLKTGRLAVQIRQSLNDLIRDTRGETIIKLRAFVAGAGDARRVQAQTADIFTERKLPLPVLSIVQVGALGYERAQVVIEAVVATRRSANPGGLAFMAGQAGASLPDALSRLQQNASAAAVGPGQILSTTCFTSRIDDYDATYASVHSRFPNSVVNVVQAIRDPLSDASTCEAVGQLSQPDARGPLVWLTAARTSLVSSRQLIFTGLQLTFGSFLDDAHEAFQRLQRAASTIQPVVAPVEVNAFSLNAHADAAVRKTTSYPSSTFTVQTVEGLPAMDASSGIEAVMAPEAASPVTAP
jgi:hypothetical protein